MQKSVSSSPKPSKPNSDIKIHSLQNLTLDGIPQKRFHRTTWNYIRLHRSAIEKRKKDEKEGEEELVMNESRWIDNQKILRLHNWKNIQASVLVSDDVGPVKAVRFLHEQNHYKIKKLAVRFNGEKSFGMHGLEIIISCLIHRQVQIQDLSLKILGLKNITKGGVNRIRRIILKNLPNLRRLEWSQCFGIQGKDAKIVASQVTKRLTVKSLFFNFGGIFLQDNETVHCIVRDIARNVPNLEKLVLCFWGSSVISNEEFKQFAEQLCRNLTDLKHLHLNFRMCGSLGPVSLKVLSKEMCENLVNLREVILSFDGCRQISTSDLETLKNELAENLPNLKYLSWSNGKNASNVLE